jgi:hypothetical protein
VTQSEIELFTGSGTNAVPTCGSTRNIAWLNIMAIPYQKVLKPNDLLVWNETHAYCIEDVQLCVREDLLKAFVSLLREIFSVLNVKDFIVKKLMLFCFNVRPPLRSSGQSSWLHNGDVLCFL